MRDPCPVICIDCRDETHHCICDDEITVCGYCGGETEELRAGDEGWTYCTMGCGCLEGLGGTTHTTYRELLRAGKI